MVRIARGMGVKTVGRLTLAAAAAAFVATAAQAAGDATAGAQVFKKCAICHNNTKGAPAKIGPNLFGVTGRKAGTFAGFSYSPAMKNSGITWTDDKIAAYANDPQKTVPGNRMPFPGLHNDKDAANVAAYLATLK